MLTLRQGSADHELTVTVQTFLRGQGLYHGAIDGDFGPGTAKAVAAFQSLAGMKADSVVGNFTWGALMARGLVMVPSDAAHDDRSGPNWPPAPLGLQPLTSAQRASIFGALDVQPDPAPNDPERVRILGKGPEYRIIEVAIPELRGVAGFPGTGACFFHTKAARQLQLLAAAWKEAGLLDRVVTWAGSLAVRYVRGSRSTLSAHAWGSAFDVNVAWNPLGAQPALTGRHGSVRELVGIANEHGFAWGGHFTRPDGMHFEIARLL